MAVLSSFLCAVQALLYSPGDTAAVYFRPDFSSAVFGFILPGDLVELEAVTAEGWLGFNPGVAQAGNSGSFRYRWLPPDSTLTDLDSLETVWAPRSGVTYAMTFNDTPLYPRPDTTSIPIMHLPGSSAAGIILQYGNWLLVNLAQSPCGCSLLGWVQTEAVSVNGELPTCELVFHSFYRKNQ